MQKDEHIVFKCPQETMGRDFAKAFGVQAGSFGYFYIILEDAQEFSNHKITALVKGFEKQEN